VVLIVDAKLFQLEYKFERVSMIREPFMVVVAFYLLFLVVIVYTRLDFTIAKVSRAWRGVFLEVFV